MSRQLHVSRCEYAWVQLWVPPKCNVQGMTTTLDVEYATVGALMLAPAHLEEVTAWLQPSDFADPLCGELYALLAHMRTADQPIDPVTVLTALQRQGRQRPDGWPAPDILTMVASVPTPRAAIVYGRLVLEDALFRLVEQAGDRLTQVGRNRRGTIAETFSTLSNQQQALARARTRWTRATATATSATPAEHGQELAPARPFAATPRRDVLAR